MKTKWFFVSCLACLVSVITTSPVVADTQNGNHASIVEGFTNWLKPQEIPKEVPSEPYYQMLPYFGGSTQEPKPNAPDEAAWALLDKLKTMPGYVWDHANPSEYIPEPKMLNTLSDHAAKAREQAKQKARREICELIKTCVRSMFW